MNAGSQIPFRKMNGLGNDFVILDARKRDIKISEDVARAIADRQSGIGCDQLIVIDKSVIADVRMRIWNYDGGEVESCGNASRCIASVLLNESGADVLSVETKGALIKCSLLEDGQVAVDMGEPRFHWSEIPLAEEFYNTRAIELQIGPIDDPILHTPSVVNVGNPHCVFWVDGFDGLDLAKIGPLLERHPMFPERANISLAKVSDGDRIDLKVWERGAGLTRACGTGACAAAVAAARKDLTGRTVTVGLPGGDLTIEWRESDDHIIMTGPVAYEFDGVLPESLVA
ncbi:MAG: diaminopimelate epimerase [Hyphomicrobiales bacterium]